MVVQLLFSVGAYLQWRDLGWLAAAFPLAMYVAAQFLTTLAQFIFWVPFNYWGCLISAFVSWGAQSSPDSAVVAPTTLGLFPGPGLGLPELIIGGLPASVVAGFKPNSKRVPTFQAVFVVDSAAYQAALDTAKNWNGRSYFLLSQNCVAFINAVAEAAGLDTPHTRLVLGLPRRPLVYLRKLARRNPNPRVFIHQPMLFDKGKPEPETFSLEPD